MVRFSSRATCAFTAILTFCGQAAAQQPTAYELLSQDTQAVVWIRSAEEFYERWDRTQLARLAKDDAVAPFFTEQRKEIEARLMEAGWRLNVKPEQLRDYAEGQIALAWIAKDDTPLKPYAIVLIADIEDDPATNQRMLKEIESQLDPKNSTKQTLSHNGTTISKFRLPPRPGELIAQDTFIAVTGGMMLTSDDLEMIKKLVDRAKENDDTKSLSKDALFTKARGLAGIAGEGQVEYFIRPLGFARVIRSIAGKRSKSSADMLAVLENQGFLAIECVCGELRIGEPTIDMQHRGYVVAQHPLPMSAGVLDFPNQASRMVPNFVGKNISSVLVTNWNAQEAFWRTEGLVDEIAGTPGVFAEVIEGIKKDPNGPKIDIRLVLPNFTNDIYSISDNKLGEAEIDSRRNLIALRVRDSAAMSEVLNKAMEGEPDAEAVDFNGHQIWKVVHHDDNETLPNDFGDFAPPPVAANNNQNQPWLSNWAITVHEDYLMFASHVEMIQDAINQTKETATSPLLESQDYKRVTAAISQYFGDRPASAWRVMRATEAYRIQYELFRKGELPKSQSMLASLLDRLLQNETEMRSKDQKISGKGLPEFSMIEKYLQPSGMTFRTTDQGWEFGSLLLSKKFEAPTDVSSTASSVGTARVSNSESEAKR